MNYNSLMNKPTINYRELIGDNSVTEVGGITEEQFNTLLNTDLSSYYTKAQIDELFARSYVFREKSGSIVTFDCPSSTPAFYQIGSEIVAVQSGSGDPSSSNIRPFTGWSVVNRYRTGKNMLRIDNETLAKPSYYSGIWTGTTTETDGSITVTRATATGGFGGIVIPTGLKAGKYTLSVNAPVTNSPKVFYYGYLLNGAYSGQKSLGSMTAGQTIKSFIINLAEDVQSIFIKMTAEQNADVPITFTNLQLEVGETASEYTAYNGTTYTTTLKDGQGNPLTCYGGGLMNVGGSQALLVTKGHIASYNGETLPSTWESDRDVYAAGTTPSIGAEVVYELETPLQIPQDSLSIVSTGGINNIWCDTGDITVKALDRIIQG